MEHLIGDGGASEIRVRLKLVRGDTAGALTTVEDMRKRAEAARYRDDLLRALILRSIALHAHGRTNDATIVLGEALVLARPGGLMRTFLDEGRPMAELLSLTPTEGSIGEYAASIASTMYAQLESSGTGAVEAADMLSRREQEVLRLIAEGYSNREIAEKLYLAESTVKGHNRRIFTKLGVQRRTEAVARGRHLGLL